MYISGHCKTISTFAQQVYTIQHQLVMLHAPMTALPDLAGNGLPLYSECVFPLVAPC